MTEQKKLTLIGDRLITNDGKTYTMLGETDGIYLGRELSPVSPAQMFMGAIAGLPGVERPLPKKATVLTQDSIKEVLPRSHFFIVRTNTEMVPFLGEDEAIRYALEEKGYVYACGLRGKATERVVYDRG